MAKSLWEALQQGTSGKKPSPGFLAALLDAGNTPAPATLAAPPRQATGGRNALLDDFRKAHPEYQQVPDYELADGIYRKFYTDKMDQTAFYDRIGLKPMQLSGKVAPKVDGATAPAASENVSWAPGQGPKGDGVPMNFIGGVNRTLLDMTGGAVDRVRNVMNWGVAGVNALTGQPDLTKGMIRDAFLDSNSIMSGLEPLGIRDPRTIQAVTPAEQLAAGAGMGVGFVLAPEMALATGARLGAVSPRFAEAMGPLFGDGKSLGGMVGNALAGGAAGVGASAGEQLAPEPYKPLAATLGGLFGAGVGAGAAMAPRGAAEGARVIGDYLAPLSERGRQRMAGQTLYEASSNPQTLARSLEGSAELVPGSMPTTFQQSGDLGLGALERGVAARNPQDFARVREQQNAARRDQLSSVGGTGSPEAVVGALRQRLEALDRRTGEAVSSAAGRAQEANNRLGQGMAPDAAGESLRTNLQAARDAAKVEERVLWKAVDPDNKLALGASSAKAEARAIQTDLPVSAKPMEGEESAIFSTVGSYRDVVPFSELTALQSRLKSAMREERFTRGETPAYARMSALNSAIQRDLDAVVAQQVAKDAEAVAAGRKGLGDTIGARLDAAVPRGGSSVYTPTGRKVDVEYRVVDASRLVPSNLDNMAPNPAYPTELQPRNRTRTASEIQVARMAGELQPERLGASPSASDGAPIVGPDGFVESGNARVLAVRKAYRDNGRSAAEYRRYLESLGYSTDGVSQPVLVRVRTSELSPTDRVRFAQEANAGSGLAMSASERAASDASRLSSDILDLFKSGDVTDGANRDFVRAFLSKVADKGEEGAFVTRGGEMSLEGAQRVRGALLHAAYEDAPLVEALLEAGDENVKSFGRALSDIAGDVARLRSGIKDGRIDPAADAAPALVEAARFVQDARRRGLSLSAAVAQTDAFSAVPEDALRVLRLAYGDKLAGRLSRERFDTVARAAIVEAERQTMDARLFGEVLQFPQILEGAGSRYARQFTEAGPGSFVPPGAGSSGGAGGQTGRGFEPGSLRAGDATGGGSGVIEQPALAPNFDQAALGRLNAARSATRNRAETFDNSQLRPLLRRPGGGTTPYEMPVSMVAPRIFAAGPKSLDAIRAYRNAFGDAAALDGLTGYAVDRLRRVALREDGTLDPGKVATWRRQHSDALRAFPELDARIVEAARSSEALSAEVAARKIALESEQLGAAGRLLGLENPQDVVSVVGGLFGRQDAAQQIMNLRARLKGNPEGEQGLKRAVADFLTRNLVSNTEVGTSGVAGIKGEQFQTFIRKNQGALKAAGFSGDEISTLEAIAADLQRANRSTSAVRIPGGSNTAQDVLAARASDKAPTMLTRVLLSLAAGGGAGAVSGVVPGVAAAVGAGVLSALRQNGIQRIDDLVKEALLNPQLAKALLMKVRPGKERDVERGFLEIFRRGVVASLAVRDEEERK